MDTVTNISSRIISLSADGFGYEIFINDTLIIRQVTPPGKPGVTGFQTEEQALAVADFVIKKIRDGAMPPSISSHELDSLLKVTNTSPQP